MKKKLTDKLIEKYNWTAPYYTSYPVLGRWNSDFSSRDLEKGLKNLSESKDLRKNEKDLSLYFHFPFCPNQCYFCFCNASPVSDSKRKEKINGFLEDISIEIEKLSEFFDLNGYYPEVREVQIGGGSPSFMNEEELNFLMNKIKLLVNPETLDEFAFEIEPRTTPLEKLKYYREIGITRVSFGVQDFNLYVQRAVNRVQSRELIESFLPVARENGMNINFDLLYGLPLQCRAGFQETVRNTIELSPDRVTLLRYAHTPERAKHQKLLEKYPFPDMYEKARIFEDAIKMFEDAGYVHVGINDFVKPEDVLAKAKEDRTLHRVFNGFTPGRSLSLIGIGPSSTSAFLGYYSQNAYAKEYGEKVREKGFPVIRGYELNQDERIRREVIFSLLANQRVIFGEIERKYGIDFNEYFRDDIERLKYFEEDGLASVFQREIWITDLGRMFVPHITSCFDEPLTREGYKISGP